jgi:Phenazine biosynthesis-like protein
LSNSIPLFYIGDINSRGVILCCEAAWKHDDDNKNANGSKNSDNNNNDNPAPTPQADFQSRFFAPKAGIDEDPVTGSAHCVLAPHFFQRLRHKTTKTTLIGHQQSPRGGFVECSMIYAKSENQEQESSSSLNGDNKNNDNGPTQEEGEQEQKKQEVTTATNGDRVRITGTTVVTMVGELY